jgi:hypothetical protein
MTKGNPQLKILLKFPSSSSIYHPIIVVNIKKMEHQDQLALLPLHYAPKKYIYPSSPVNIQPSLTYKGNQKKKKVSHFHGTENQGKRWENAVHAIQQV